MNTFADYNFYYSEYLQGRAELIPIGDFAHYAMKATSEIVRYTGDNITDDIPDEARLCCCEAAELLYRYDTDSRESGVTSERVGDLSQTFESAKQRADSKSRAIRECVYRYLASGGRLYRGVRG